MARTRKEPKLRVYKEKYYCTDVYLPNGKRSTIGFGTTDDRSLGEIYTTFGQWIDMFSKQPQKVFRLIRHMRPFRRLSVRPMLRLLVSYWVNI